MAVAQGTVAGLAARIARVSYCGELSFEVNVAARSAPTLFDAILAAGAPLGITPYGVASLMVLRTEKGYLHVGTDTDGSSTPDDVGWGHVAHGKSGDFIGKRSLTRPANLNPESKQLIGLKPLDPNQRIRPGGHLLLGAGRQAPALTDGWVTSACYSPTLDHYIALGALRGGSKRLGEVVTVCDEDHRFNVKVVPRMFYDPSNSRLGS
jgi:sarcosine oxidase subunit alpha